MKSYIILFFLATALIFFSCQKNLDLHTQESHHVLLDSLVGQWVYEYDYVLISTQANPTVITDSVFSGNYAPLSYFKINADSSYRWWRTEGNSLPAYGYGVSGKIVVINDTMRYIRKNLITQTDDNFNSQTLMVPICVEPEYNIKMLTNKKVVFTFTVPTSDGRLFHWHDVYTR